MIEKNPEYDLVDIYADEGISGTNTKKREEFKRMIDDCRAGRIDLIITKSISRFARNTCRLPSKTAICAMFGGQCVT